jgi:hypothetical protein
VPLPPSSLSGNSSSIRASVNLAWQSLSSYNPAFPLSRYQHEPTAAPSLHVML